MTHKIILEDTGGKIGYNSTYSFDIDGTLILNWRNKVLKFDGYEPGDYVYIIFDGKNPKIGKIKQPKSILNFIMWSMGVKKDCRYFDKDKYMNYVSSLQKLYGYAITHISDNITNSDRCHQISMVDENEDIKILCMLIAEDNIPKDIEERNEALTTIFCDCKWSNTCVPFNQIISRLVAEEFSISQINRIYESYTKNTGNE